jgi:hypothetical protein
MYIRGLLHKGKKFTIRVIARQQTRIEMFLILVARATFGHTYDNKILSGVNRRYVDRTGGTVFPGATYQNGGNVPKDNSYNIQNVNKIYNMSIKCTKYP